MYRFGWGTSPGAVPRHRTHIVDGWGEAMLHGQISPVGGAFESDAGSTAEYLLRFQARTFHFGVVFGRHVPHHLGLDRKNHSRGSSAPLHTITLRILKNYVLLISWGVDAKCKLRKQTKTCVPLNSGEGVAQASE